MYFEGEETWEWKERMVGLDEDRRAQRQEIALLDTISCKAEIPVGSWESGTQGERLKGDALHRKKLTRGRNHGVKIGEEMYLLLLYMKL